MRAVLHFDGACRGNPGPSAGGAVLICEVLAGNPPQTVGTNRHEICGTPFHGTNNEAEYAGLLLGLHGAHKHGVRELTIRGDSMLVVNQIKGVWRVKKENLKPLHAEAMALLQHFQVWNADWVPRHLNADADTASNKALDNPRRPTP